MSKRLALVQVGSERPKKNDKHLDRLTRDAIAAEQAGMSYGAWKALHPHTPGDDDQGELIVEDAGKVLKPCAWCGKLFAVGKQQTNKLYCSDTCRTAKGNAMRPSRKAPGQVASCASCGADFVVDHQHRVYCCMECYIDGQRKRTKMLRERAKQEGKAND